MLPWKDIVHNFHVTGVDIFDVHRNLYQQSVPGAEEGCVEGNVVFSTDTIILIREVGRWLINIRGWGQV